jgi:FlgD Ig-like domain
VIAQRPRLNWHAVAKEATPTIPESTEFCAPSPNPFNPRTTVAFFVQTPGRVTIDVYDLRGRRVKSLQRGNVSAGAHEVVWTGVDDRGVSVASGVYFLRLTTPTGVHLKRAALVR